MGRDAKSVGCLDFQSYAFHRDVDIVTRQRYPLVFYPAGHRHHVRTMAFSIAVELWARDSLVHYRKGSVTALRGIESGSSRAIAHCTRLAHPFRWLRDDIATHLIAQSVAYSADYSED